MEISKMNNERYFADVVAILDSYKVIINVGANRNLVNGTKFLIVGIGEEILDPKTGESLGNVEIIRGHAQVIHVQEKISTLESIDWVKKPDVREITKISKRTNGQYDKLFPFIAGISKKTSSYDFLAGNSEETTEIIKPQAERLKALENVEIGDKIILVK